MQAVADVRLLQNLTAYLCYSFPLTGAKQTADILMTLHNNGDLSITNVTYGYAGKFVCIVQNAHIGAYVTHNLNIECKFFVIFLLTLNS